MNSTIIGAVMMLIIIVLLATKKISMIPAFTLIPIITLFVLGYKPSEFKDILSGNVNSAMTSTGLLLMFSITFFSFLSETGVFDTIIQAIVRLTRGNVFVILFATVVIASIAQMDGSMITTYVITIPPLIGLYDRMKLDRRILLLLTAYVTIALAPPWAAGLNQSAMIANLDVFTLFEYIVPIIFIIYGLIAIICVYFGIQHRRTYGKISVAEEENLIGKKKDGHLLRPHLFWVNCGLLVGLLVCVNMSGLPAYVTFMVFLGLVLLIDYPNSADQSEIFRKTAPTYFNPVMLILSIAVLVGMLNNTGIMKSFSEIIVSLLPVGLLRYAHIIFALLIVPVCQFIPYQVYMALFPFLIGIGEACGIPSVVVISAFALNLMFGTCCSRYVAQTHLGIGLINVGREESADECMDSYVKWAVPKCLIMNTATIVICVVLGIL